MFGIPFGLAASVFVLGLIFGSFANVVIYRLHTGKSLNNRSHCLSCNRTLYWYELIPLISYVFLRARCRTCGSYIPFRYVVVEILAGLLFVGIVCTVHDPIAMMLIAFFMLSLLIAAVYDLIHLIIPDETVIAAILLALITRGYESYQANDGTIILWAVVAGVIAFLFFWSLWFLSKGKWIGLGDAKLAAPLGLMVGLGGVFSLIVLSFWVGAVVSLLIMSIQRARNGGQSPLLFGRVQLKMKSEVPFAPFLIIAFLSVFFFGVDVLSLTTYVLI